MNDTANSNPINAINITNGIKVTIITNKLLVNNCYKKVDRIFNRV